MLTIQNNAGVILAYLNNIENGTVKEVLNGEFTLQFIATIEPLKTNFLYDTKNYVVYNDDFFKVTEIEELHSMDEGMRVSINAEHISYTLLDYEMVNFDYTYQTANFVMSKCLEGTDFRLLNTDITLKTDIQYKEACNKKQISMAIANNWKGELKYFRKDIELLQQRGSNRGVAFRFGHNLKTVKRRRSFIEQTINYEVEVLNGSELDELGYYELGDTIRVVDDAMEIEVDVRIVELEKDIVTNLNSRVTLGNLLDKLNTSLAGLSNKIDKAEEATKEVSNALDQGKTEWDKIKDITDDYGNVIAEKLSGKIDTGNAEISSTSGHITWSGNTIKIHDQPSENNSNWCMELGAAGWRIAHGKDSQGAWRWRTMATGTGIVADEITSGTLSAISIQGVNISGTEITGGSVRGANISGGTLNIGNNNYIVDAQGNLTCNGSVVLAGNVLMNGHVSWGAENSPVKVQYSVDGRTNWHNTFNNDDKFARYSYDGGNSYTPAIKIVGTDGTSVKIVGEVSNPSLLPPTANIGDAYICQGDLWVFIGGTNKWQNVGRIKGDDGIPGANGTDGKTYYTWIKYALDANGSGMQNDIGQFKVNELTVTVSNMHTKVSDMQNRKYLGIAHNKSTATESNNASDYQWSLIVGEDGKDGANGQDGATGDKGENGANGSDGITYYTWIVYADTSSGSGITTNPTDKAYMGIRYNMLTQSPSMKPSDYTFFKVKGENGSDANVPAYIKDTYIDSTIIKSPTIQGNVINAGTVTGGYIKGTTIDGNTIKGGTINGTEITGGSVRGTDVYIGTGTGIRYEMVQGRRLTMLVNNNVAGYMGEYGVDGVKYYGFSAGGYYNGGISYYMNGLVVHPKANRDVDVPFVIDAQGQGIETKDNIYSGAVYSCNLSDLEIKNYELEYKINLLTGTTTLELSDNTLFVNDWKIRYNKGVATLEMIDRLVNVGKISGQEKQYIINEVK